MPTVSSLGRDLGYWGENDPACNHQREHFPLPSLPSSCATSPTSECLLAVLTLVHSSASSTTPSTPMKAGCWLLECNLPAWRLCTAKSHPLLSTLVICEKAAAPCLNNMCLFVFRSYSVQPAEGICPQPSQGAAITRTRFIMRERGHALSSSPQHEKLICFTGCLAATKGISKRLIVEELL